MMAGKESVEPAMDTTEAELSHPVDYYYLKALRYLSSGDDSDNSDNENNSSCQQCHGDEDGGIVGEICDDTRNKVEGGQRERSWSHSMAEEYESETVGQLPGKQKVQSTGRVNTRRFSDGMLLKSGMKVSNGRVHWADDCQKELTRSRPRKKYVRNPALTAPPIKSILKNVSEDCLVDEDDPLE
ncbi:unnamed protein product [Lymnaea stagnalis]|uniref:Uncharacterized protein n=1 Tax=Lymnaea stagnalis TaxID=6523 RepID=A0AAV2I080_LYMST